MRYFLDTEFIETGDMGKPTIDLISIGVVCEDSREYYAISNEFQEHLASDWVKENVIKQLPLEVNKPELWRSRAHIKQDLLSFIGPDPEFWGYYADYDWVVFCWLFGNMIDLPKGWPMYCRDLKQMADMCGGAKFPKQKDGEHNALEDAKWNMRSFNWMAQRNPAFYQLLKIEKESGHE